MGKSQGGSEGKFKRKSFFYFYFTEKVIKSNVISHYCGGFTLGFFNRQAVYMLPRSVL